MKPVSDERCCHVVDWLAADEAALDYIATRIGSKSSSSPRIRQEALCLSREFW